MTALPDFSPGEREAIEAALATRCGPGVTVEIAHAEARLDPASPEMAVRAPLYRESQGVGFMVFRDTPQRWRSQFLCSMPEQFGTGHDYDDRVTCVTTTLRLQVDHAKDHAGATSGKPAADFGH